LRQRGVASTISDELRDGRLATLRTKAGVVHQHGRSVSPLREAFVRETIQASEEAAR
jgi:hypothetical protein